MSRASRPAEPPPANLDAEQAVLGCILLEGRDRLPDVAAILTLPDFYTGAHRTTYEAMLALSDRGEPIDLITVTEELRRSGQLEAAGGPAGLALLVEQASIAANVSAYVEIVREHGAKRELQQLAGRIGLAAQNGTRAADVIADIAPELERLQRRAMPLPRAEGFLLYDAAAAEGWGFPAPAFIIDRLLPLLGTVWVGGLPKRGKSLFVLYLALAIACQRARACNHFVILAGPKILYVTREDGGPRLKDRIADILSAWTERPAPGALRFVIKPRIDLMNTEHVAWLRETCLRDGITVVVLDTWTALSPAADPLSPKDQAVLAAVIVQLAEDIAGLVIVVDHSRKNRPEGSILSSADIFGSPQKWAAAEHVIMLDHAGGDENRWEVFVEGKDSDSIRFFRTKSARDSGGEKLAYAGDVEALGAEARALGDANRQAVLGILRGVNGAWLSTAEIVEALARAKRNLSRDTVQRHLAALLKGGAPVDQAGKGRSTRYCATDTPRVPSAAKQGAANE